MSASTRACSCARPRARPSSRAHDAMPIDSRRSSDAPAAQGRCRSAQPPSTWPRHCDTAARQLRLPPPARRCWPRIMPDGCRLQPVGPPRGRSNSPGSPLARAELAASGCALHRAGLSALAGAARRCGQGRHRPACRCSASATSRQQLRIWNGKSPAHARLLDVRRRAARCAPAIEPAPRRGHPAWSALPGASRHHCRGRRDRRAAASAERA